MNREEVKMIIKYLESVTEEYKDLLSEWDAFPEYPGTSSRSAAQLFEHLEKLLNSFR